MKKTHLVFLIILFCIPAFSTQARKTALLVGAGVSASFSRPLLQSERGLKLIRTTLIQQGFNDADILQISGQDATLSGIRNALETLLAKTGKGDMVMFCFYGHGTQTADDGQEEPDRLDEALLPYDAVTSHEKPGENLLLDDELAQWLYRLRKKSGAEGQVFILLEACHSGGSMRGNRTPAGKSRYKMELQGEEDAELAPFVAFYSSMPHQPSLEMFVEDGERLGLLTWAFCRAMGQVNEKSTWRGLFEQTELYIRTLSYKQTPQIEGMQDLLVFGGRVAAPLPYFRAITMINNREMLLGAGQIQGLHPGTRMALYPGETRDTASATPLAFGLVQEERCGLYECTILLDRPIADDQVAAAWIFVRENRFLQNSLYIYIEADEPGEAARIGESLTILPSVKIANTPAGAMSLFMKGTKLQLRSEEGVILWESGYRKENMDKTLKALQEELDKCLQARFLGSLEFGESPYKTEFSVKTASETSDFSPVARLRVQKDTAFLRIANKSQKPVFYTIIDIDSRNKVSILLPGPTGIPAEYRLKPGEVSALHRVRFDTPGREVLKLIVTPVPIDLRPALASRGMNNPGKNYLESLFAHSFRLAASERGAGMTYGGMEAGVATVVLDIVK